MLREIFNGALAVYGQVKFGYPMDQAYIDMAYQELLMPVWLGAVERRLRKPNA